MTALTLACLAATALACLFAPAQVVSDERLDKMVADFDTDGSGELEFDECSAGLGTLPFLAGSECFDFCAL